jgi:hypothetical protein
VRSDTFARRGFSGDFSDLSSAPNASFIRVNFAHIIGSAIETDGVEAHHPILVSLTLIPTGN